MTKSVRWSSVPVRCTELAQSVEFGVRWCLPVGAPNHRTETAGHHRAASSVDGATEVEQW